jgi:hypothetical protein
MWVQRLLRKESLPSLGAMMDTKEHADNVKKLYAALADPDGLLHDIAHAKRPNTSSAYDSDAFRRSFEEHAERHVSNFIEAAREFRHDKEGAPADEGT